MDWWSWFSKPKPFIDAVQAGKARDIQKHLAAGVDLNKKIDGGNAYPLHFAVHAGADIVYLLLSNGANADVSAGDDGKTPLHIAAACGYPEIAVLLVDAGAQVNATDKYGHTPMFDAAYTVTPYSNLIATFGSITGSGEGVAREETGRGAVADLLRLRGATPSAEDLVAAKAIGTIPEANRQDLHLRLAYNSGDIDYRHAVQEVSMEYPYLCDAYRLLRKKSDLSASERTFLDKFEEYERHVM